MGNMIKRRIDNMNKLVFIISQKKDSITVLDVDNNFVGQFLKVTLMGIKKGEKNYKWIFKLNVYKYESLDVSLLKQLCDFWYDGKDGSLII